MIYYNMTTLSETEISNPVELKGYQFSCDDIICQDIPAPLPGSEEGYFRMAIIGKSGSGKTNLLRCLTERNGKHKIYCKRFTNVFYISPSVKSMENRPKLPEDHFYTSLRDLPTIFDRIQNEEDKEGRTLLIMDDISQELKRDADLIIKQLFQNNRHLGRPLLDDNGNQLESGSVSIIILAQRLNNLPRAIRSQITHYAIFDPRATKSELHTIFDELIHVDKHIFNQILKKTFSKLYNFLFIDTNYSRMYNGFKSEFLVETDNYL